MLINFASVFLEHFLNCSMTIDLHKLCYAVDPNSNTEFYYHPSPRKDDFNLQFYGDNGNFKGISTEL